MKLLKRTLLIMITFVIITTLIGTIQNNFYISSINAIGNPPRVGVLSFNFNDPYISFVKQSLENIEKENPTKVIYSFYDAKDNQSIQNADIDALINNNIDLLLVNLVDTKQSTFSNIIDKANSKNIPLIFFNVKAIIANNDAMAIGAIEALQAYGYNKGNKTKNIAKQPGLLLLLIRHSLKIWIFQYTSPL